MMREPTPEMIEAGCETWWNQCQIVGQPRNPWADVHEWVKGPIRSMLKEIWQAMVAAAPPS